MANHQKKRTVFQAVNLSVPKNQCLQQSALICAKTSKHLLGSAFPSKLTQVDIDSLALSVADNVRQVTGWDLRIPQIRMFSHSEMFSYMQQNNISNTAHWLTASLNRFELWTDSTSIIAFYNSQDGVLGVVKEGISLMNYDYLRSVLHHELVHVAQVQTFPQFHRDLQKYLLIQRYKDNHRENARTIQACVRLASSYLEMLIEGHANLLERQSRITFYPEAQVKKNFFCTICPEPLKYWVESCVSRAANKCLEVSGHRRSFYSGADIIAAHIADHGGSVNVLINDLFASSENTVDFFAMAIGKPLPQEVKQRLDLIRNSSGWSNLE